MLKKCEVCGKEFEAKRDARYCSSSCYQKHYAKTKKLESKNCIICGAWFQPIRKGHICCSEKCSRIRNNAVTEQQKKNRYHEEKLKRQAKEAMPKSNHDKIADIAIEARKHGMTYGQYVAWKGL